MATRRAASAASTAAPAKKTAAPKASGRDTKNRTNARRTHALKKQRGEIADEASADQMNEPRKGVKVTAFRMGIYGHKRRRDGDTFILRDPKDFNPSWMIEAEPSTPTSITTPLRALAKEHDRILGGKVAETPGRLAGRAPAPTPAAGAADDEV